MEKQRHRWLYQGDFEECFLEYSESPSAQYRHVLNGLRLLLRWLPNRRLQATTRSSSTLISSSSLGPPQNENRVAVTPSSQPTSKTLRSRRYRHARLPIEKSSPRSLRAPFQPDQVFQSLDWHVRIKPPTSKTKDRSHVTRGEDSGLLQAILYRHGKGWIHWCVWAKKAKGGPAVNERKCGVSVTN